MEVRQHQGWRVRRVLPRQRGRRQHGAHPVRGRGRRRGLLQRHDFDRGDGGRECQHPSRRHGRGIRAWAGRPDVGGGGADARRGTDYWRRLGGAAPGARAVVRRRRDGRLRERRRRRAHHGIDRWRGRRFGDRGAGWRSFFSERNPGHQAGRHHLQRGLSWQG